MYVYCEGVKIAVATYCRPAPDRLDMLFEGVQDRKREFSTAVSVVPDKFA